MNISLLACAESVVLDQRRNTLSIFNIVEELSSPIFPFVVPHLTVITLFTRAAEEPSELEDIHLQVTSGGQTLIDAPMDGKFFHHSRLRHVSELQGLVISGPGTLVVTAVRGKTNVLGSWAIPVINIGQPTLQPELPLSGLVT